MAYTFGARLDDDSYALTTIDEDQGTATTKGEINGVPFEGGGGGSSDFSTAEVVVTDFTGGSSGFLFCAIGDSNNGAYGSIEPTMGADIDGTYIMPLYKGHASAYTGTSAITVNTTGAVEYDDGWFDITGDCTITISNEG